MRLVTVLAVSCFALSAIGTPASASIPYGTYDWPVQGPVIRAFEPPTTPYTSGHRGIDIAVPFGTQIRAPADGVVSFSGKVAGSLFISIDHAGGIRTTYSWISSSTVKKGQAVGRGDVIGFTGSGHPGESPAHLHFGVRLGGDYLDPLLLLEVGSVVDRVRLSPL